MNCQTDSPLLLQVLKRTEEVPQARQDGLLATSVTSSTSAPPTITTAFSTSSSREQYPPPPPFTSDGVGGGGGGGGGGASESQSETKVSHLTKQTKDDALKSSKSSGDKRTGGDASSGPGLTLPKSSSLEEGVGEERRQGTTARSQLPNAAQGETQPDSSSDVHRLLSGENEKKKGTKGKEGKKEQGALSEDSTRLPLSHDHDSSTVHR